MNVLSGRAIIYVCTSKEQILAYIDVCRQQLARVDIEVVRLMDEPTLRMWGDAIKTSTVFLEFAEMECEQFHDPSTFNWERVIVWLAYVRALTEIATEALTEAGVIISLKVLP